MREILLNICLTAVALCIFKMLVPENSMKKQTNFLISCFFLSALIFFFTSTSFRGDDFTYAVDFSGASIPYANFEDEYANAQKRAIERETGDRISRLLADEEIFPEEIYIIVNISDEHSISINEIKLVLVSKEGEGNDEGNEESEEASEALEELKKAVRIVQKEVGRDIIISGELKNE